jgi:N-acetylglucosaminyldiphosphoundecaprenol N-acetyl-beta-D-mannosaminyltransferase
MMRQLVVILGVPVDNLTMTETVDRLTALVAAGRASGKSHQVVTVNADFVKNAMLDPEVRYLLQDADLACADGMPLVWGARLLDVPLKGRITGADLVPLLAERAAEQGYSIYLLGAAPGVAAAAAALLKQRYPRLKIAGVNSPPVGPVLEMGGALLADIRAARPDILLVAFGNPKQEKWIGMYKQQLSVPVMIGVGGTLDFLTGTTKRAPQWMQRSGLEWLYRLLREPGRLWKRYVGDLVVFGFFFARQWLLMRRGGTYADLLPAADLVVADNAAIIKIQGSLTISNYSAFNALVEKALTVTPHILVHMAQAKFLDSAAIGSLVHFAKQAREANGELALVEVPRVIATTLAMLRLTDFFRRYDSLEAALAAQGNRPVAASPAAPAEAAPTALKTDTSRWLVVRGPRRIDASTVPAFQQQVTEALQARRFVVLDLAETVILTSAGLAALALLNRLALEQQGALRVTGCTKDVMQVIEMVRFDKVLSLYRDVSSATA